MRGRYYEVYMSADGLLEIFFSCKEQKHMGHVVLIADVGFLIL